MSNDRVRGTSSVKLLLRAQARVARASNAECAQMLGYMIGQAAVFHEQGMLHEAVGIAQAVNLAWDSLFADGMASVHSAIENPSDRPVNQGIR